MERRRSWAASGRLPPKLAARFTLAEQAVLAVIAVEVVRKDACTLTLEHVAALAGVCRTTVKNALREAVSLGLIRVEERRLSAWRNLPHRITITAPEWVTWLRIGRRGEGAKSHFPRPTDSRKPSPQSQAERGNSFVPPRSASKPPGTALGQPPGAIGKPRLGSGGAK
jgi:hypothetical protein